MKKIFLVILMVLVFASNSFAVTYYFKTAGVNNDWSNGANWCDQTNGTGTCGTAPTASIDTVLDSNSGNVTVDTTTCLAKTLTCTGYNGTLTFTAANQLSVSGSVTFASTMTLAGTGTLRMTDAGTITMGTLTFPGSVILAASGTYPLTEDLNITGTMSFTGNAVFSGAFGISCGTLTFSSSGLTIQIVSGQTLTVTTAINIAGNGFATNTIRSVTASSDAFLHYNGLAANCKIAGATFTDINAVHALDNWYGGTLTRTTGITNRTSADIGGGGPYAF